MDSVRMVLKGAHHEVTEYNFDVYYIYSRREKKNIPVLFKCGEGRDGVNRVWGIEFPSNKNKGSKTVNIRTAFWVEHWKSINR